MARNTIPCQNCLSRGYLTNQTDRCPVCKGRGYIIAGEKKSKKGTSLFVNFIKLLIFLAIAYFFWENFLKFKFQ